MPTTLLVSLDAVIVAVTDAAPRLLTVGDALPSGPLDAHADETLEKGMRRLVTEQAGLDLGYVEQLYTFGDLRRSPRAPRGATRHLSVAYLALIKEDAPLAGASWRDWYELLPWEDRRRRAPYVDRHIAPVLRRWIQEAPAGRAREARRLRAATTFGLDGAPWDGVKVLERYELAYEAGGVAEAWRDRGAEPARALPPSRAMAADYRRIAATALGRLRGKITYRPVIFELLPDTFTLSGLQQTVEALGGAELHTQNFRRLVERTGLVEGTGERTTATGGRPAERFRFRREVLLERPRAGLGHPGAA